MVDAPLRRRYGRFVSGRVGAYLRQNVLGLVAIFLALSAGAYAVQKAPKNSVVSKSIKNGQVHHEDLGAASVSGEKIADGTIELAKLGYDPATQGELDPIASAVGLADVAGVDQQRRQPRRLDEAQGRPRGIRRRDQTGCSASAPNDISGDTTPSVANLSVLSFEFPAPLTITAWRMRSAARSLVLRDALGGGTVTINDALPFVLSANWVSTSGDTLTLASVGGGIWAEVARSAN